MIYGSSPYFNPKTKIIKNEAAMTHLCHRGLVFCQKPPSRFSGRGLGVRVSLRFFKFAFNHFAFRVSRVIWPGAVPARGCWALAVRLLADGTHGALQSLCQAADAVQIVSLGCQAQVFDLALDVALAGGLNFVFQVFQRLFRLVRSVFSVVAGCL